MRAFLIPKNSTVYQVERFMKLNNGMSLGILEPGNKHVMETLPQQSAEIDLEI